MFEALKAHFTLPDQHQMARRTMLAASYKDSLALAAKGSKNLIYISQVAVDTTPKECQ